ncbi:MAG: LemA family protein [Elusimicrobia bacterium]|nr:LemA family protein [Elusimicrobiota bacterium]
MEPQAHGLSSELFKRICRHQIVRSQNLKTRLLNAWKERWQEFKLLLKEHPSLAWTIRIAVPLAVLLIWMGIIMAYNMYALCRTDCELYHAQVGVEVKRRADLIPNLVVCVSQYSAHEKNIMKHVADVRQALSSSNDIGTRIAASKAIEGALARLMAIVEQYPNLKASDPVQSLIKEISNTENRIAELRGKYNESARAFNNLYTTIPTNWLGWCFGIRKPVPYINTDEDLIRAYMVKFGKEQGL